MQVEKSGTMSENSWRNGVHVTVALELRHTLASGQVFLRNLEA